MRSLTLLSWAFLAIATLAVAAAAYAGQALQDAATAHAVSAQAEAQQLDRKAYAARVEAIALETEDERAELEAFMHLDIVSAAGEFERVGARAGAAVSVTDATPQGGIELQGGGNLQWIAFAIAADGSYESLMRTLELYESLPLALEVTQLELDQVDGVRSWRMTLRIRVLAITADV